VRDFQSTPSGPGARSSGRGYAIGVYPAHFSGAACGKGLSGKPGSTIGFERRVNPALQLTSKDDFVRFVLADLPSQPAEFALNR
jgi:hypothetical protein